MTDETTPRATFRNAFYQILNTALGSEIEVVKYRPPEGVPARSIVLGIVSGSNRVPALGQRVSPTQTGLEECYRIQIDVFELDREQAEVIADRVEQTIKDALDTLRSTYGVDDVKKLVDADVGATEQLQREGHVIMDYEGCILTTQSD